MSNPTLPESVRIGTLVKGGTGSADYIRQILPHGFESFQLFFWKNLGGTDLTKIAPKINETLAGSGAIVSSLEICGNPLETAPDDLETLEGWKQCIDHAHLFGTNLVCGFSGRLRNKPLPESIPRFKSVFGDLARRAADRGVRIAFENCWMGGNWKSGDWNIAVSPDAWEMMFDAVPAPELGLEWEPCHQLCELIDPMPQLRTWVPKIFHVHGKDASIYWDVIRKHGVAGPHAVSHHRHPGFGDSNWTDIISELRRHGFKGCIDIEGWHDPVYRDELEMTGQVASLNYLKRCRGGSLVPNPITNTNP